MKVIGLFFVFLFCVFVQANCQSNSQATDVVTFIEKHGKISPLTNQIQCDSVNLFDISDLTNNSIFLIGELHDTRFNPLVQAEMVCMLNSIGYNNIILEEGHGLGYLMNQYIQKPDSILLNWIQESYYGLYIGNKPDSGRQSELNYIQKKLEFLNILLDLNSKSAERAGIRIYGVDYETFDLYSAYRALNIILDNQNDSANQAYWECKRIVKSVLDTMPQTSNNRLSLNENIPGNLLARLEKANRTEFRSIMGEEYPEFIRILQSINQSDVMLKFGKYGQIPYKREKFLYHEINRIKEKNSIDRYIGIFGASHVLQKPFLHRIFGSLASKLQNKRKSRYHRKVNSVLPIILKGNFMNSSLPEQFTYTTLLEDACDFVRLELSVIPNSYGIVPINISNSPLKKTKKNGQYLLIVNDRSMP